MIGSRQMLHAARARGRAEIQIGLALADDGPAFGVGVGSGSASLSVPQKAYAARLPAGAAAAAAGTTAVVSPGAPSCRFRLNREAFTVLFGRALSSCAAAAAAACSSSGGEPGRPRFIEEAIFRKLVFGRGGCVHAYLWSPVIHRARYGYPGTLRCVLMITLLMIARCDYIIIKIIYNKI